MSQLQHIRIVEVRLIEMYLYMMRERLSLWPVNGFKLILHMLIPKSFLELPMSMWMWQFCKKIHTYSAHHAWAGSGKVTEQQGAGLI